MAFLLRKIRKNRWYQEDAVPYLQAGDAPADPLADLNTQENSLSMFYVEDNRSNLDRVVTALAANCQAISNLDYALIDQSLLSAHGLKAVRTPGAVPDATVSSFWHWDLVELSARRLVVLAHVILTKGEIGRILEKRIAELIREAIKEGNIDPATLPPQLANRITR
jgi:hypothetical protein